MSDSLITDILALINFILIIIRIHYLEKKIKQIESREKNDL